MSFSFNLVKKQQKYVFFSFAQIKNNFAVDYACSSLEYLFETLLNLAYLYVLHLSKLH